MDSLCVEVAVMGQSSLLELCFVVKAWAMVEIVEEFYFEYLFVYFIYEGTDLY
jgi:hypothetical protein